MSDFWRSSGFHLLEREAGGRLRVTDAYLRSWIESPQMRPPAQACAAERALHAALLEAPRRAVRADEIERLADPDARDNFRALLAFRTRLLAAGSVEACYLGLMRAGNRDVAPLFVERMVELILRNLLDGESDALALRAAELFFRPQRVHFEQGAIVVADAATVELHAAGGSFGDIGRLLARNETRLASVALDVLDAENAHLYWLREHARDTALALHLGRPGLDALCRVQERWVRQLLGVAVRITPLREISEPKWAWHIGLDREAMQLLNDLYRGEAVDAQRLARMIALFRLEFADAREMRADLAGRPVYLALAADEAGELRMKPQNLLLNLPLAGSA
jgi:hypothetical protein